MAQGASLAYIQSKVQNDLQLVDGTERVTYQQLSDSGSILNTITNVLGFGLEEVFSSVFGLDQITRHWNLQSNTMPTVTRVNCLDRLTDSLGAVWILTHGAQIVWQTQWACDSIRLDCLISICGTTADVYQGTSVADAAGGYTWNWGNSPLYPMVSIRIVKQSSRVTEEDEQSVMVNNLKVWTIQTGLQLGQALVIGGIYYLVMGVEETLNRAIGSPIWYQVDCEQKQVMR